MATAFGARGLVTALAYPPALASRIVEHRRRHGPFKRPQDVVIVRGMSAKLYRRIAHLIRI